jgi:hypothetical protein
VLASLPAGNPLPSISTFAEDGLGNLYVPDCFSGDVYKIVPVPEPSGGLIFLAAAISAAAFRRRAVTRG